MAGRSKTRQPQRQAWATGPHVEEVVRILLHLRRGLVGRAPGPSDLRRLARRFGATAAEIQAWSTTENGRRVLSSWSVDALEALRPGARTGVYHLEAQILACEQEADAQARRKKVSANAARKAASPSGGNGQQVREEADARDAGKTDRKSAQTAEKRQSQTRRGVKADPRSRLRVDLPRAPGVLKIYGAQSPPRPLPDVVEKSVPSRPVGWSVTATWTGGE